MMTGLVRWRAWALEVATLRLAGCLASSSPRPPTESTDGPAASLRSVPAAVSAEEAASAPQFQPRPPPDGNDSPRTCRLAYSHYPDRSELFVWRTSAPPLPAHVRMRLRAHHLANRQGAVGNWSSEGIPLQVWLFDDGRLFFSKLDRELHIEDVQFAQPACRIDAGAMARFDAALLSPRRLVPPLDRTMPSEEDIIEVPSAFALPWIVRNAVRQNMPLCFEDEATSTWLTKSKKGPESPFSSGVRIDVAHGERQVSLQELGGYADVLREIIGPLRQVCPELKSRLALSISYWR